MIDYAKNILLGKTVWRSSMNMLLKNETIYGKTIDFGGKTSKASYFEYIKKSNDLKMIYTDLFPNSDEDVIQLNVLEKFNIEDKSFDNTLAFNLLEHLPSIENFKKEVFRILKDDGQLIIAVPYLFPYHPDPEDYFRYSDKLLIKEFEEVGFTYVKSLFPKVGPFSTFTDYLLLIALPSKIRIFIKPIFMLLALLIDKIVLTYRPIFNHRPTNETFATGFVIVFKKVAK